MTKTKQAFHGDYSDLEIEATAIYLCELFNANAISVKKALADYREFLTQFDSVGFVSNHEPAWS